MRFEHTAMPITLGGNDAIGAPGLPRATLGWRSSATSISFKPCTAKRFTPDTMEPTSEIQKATRYASPIMASRSGRPGRDPI